MLSVFEALYHEEYLVLSTALRIALVPTVLLPEAYLYFGLELRLGSFPSFVSISLCLFRVKIEHEGGFEPGLDH